MNDQACKVEAAVLRHEAVCPGFYCLELDAPLIATKAQPGQFVQVRVSRGLDPLLPRPISFFGIDAAAGTVRLLYAAIGKGTQLLAELAVGEKVTLWGPLGQGWALPEAITAAGEVMPVFVAGGIGIAPLLPLAAAWAKAGQPGMLLYGGRSQSLMPAIGDFEALGVKVALATEDGSAGHQGYVTGLLDQVAQASGEQTPLLYVCGPHPMLNAVQQAAAARNWRCQVSMEERMCCGLGACLSCVCKHQAEGAPWTYAKVCTDGPVFWREEVIWDD
ncbi:dihydroorotate dehydrogenase electron transfer subunit [Heliophilum fasciatum]|uniref:Dihydroorotate dehydrogenase B (NAD(+)), electron transfer subunit n=1 Tax=Heliophilum fasciatum TaxID=35700 RepID=A0A4R2S6Y2_9FIRM|nr:dihydroorotate dehydrogenase electron transfer subunit [Heliophilum fasciatum]MCW2277224.1 dihydroorotate dehydrogenase electron transfer subunit [Heliophilum fasciatum]TCP68141.1 dihydroorotate oxidase B electron transfer subunit [Heliophilum fasciatum]